MLKSKVAPNTAVPLAFQPLRISTADRTVSHSIDASLKQHGKKPAFSIPAPPPGRAGANSGGPKRATRPLRLSPPRKRQKQNVETIASVMAARRAEAESESNADAQAQPKEGTFEVGAGAKWVNGVLVKSTGVGQGIKVGGKVSPPGKAKEKGKARISPRRTLSWPNGTVPGPRPATPTPTPAPGPGGLLPAANISPSLRAMIANPAGLLFTGPGQAHPRSPNPAGDFNDTSLPRGMDALVKLASCSYAGPMSGGSVPAAPVPWVALPGRQVDERDELVHDIEVGENAMDIDGLPRPSAHRAGVARNMLMDGWLAGESGVTRSPRPSQGEWGAPSSEHLRGRVVEDADLIEPDWSFWSTDSADKRAATLFDPDGAELVTRSPFGRETTPWQPMRRAVESHPPSPDRPGSSFPKSFSGAYSLSALPQTPPWDAEPGAGAALPGLKQERQVEGSAGAERQAGPSLATLGSSPSCAELIDAYMREAEAEGSAGGDAMPGAEEQQASGRATPPRADLVAPSPRWGSRSGTSATSPFRPAWISLGDGAVGAVGGSGVDAGETGGVARLSPERLGGLRRRSVEPGVGGVETGRREAERAGEVVGGAECEEATTGGFASVGAMVKGESTGAMGEGAADVPGVTVGGGGATEGQQVSLSRTAWS